MKYKVGDKVRVRDWDDMEKEFGTNGKDVIIPRCYFICYMEKYCNCIVTISGIEHYGTYHIEEDNNCWFWCDEMFEPVKSAEVMLAQLAEINKKKSTSFVTCDVDELCDTLDNVLDGMKKKIDEYDKEINEMKKETKLKQKKQKTKRERLEEKIAKYKVGSGIDSIEVIVPNKVVKIKMDPMFSHWKLEYKMVCNDQDNFSMERALYLAYAKDECCGKYTSEGIEAYADQISMEKKFVAKVKAAMNLYENQEELKKLDDEEAATIQRKREKRWKQKERRAERKRNEQIAIQKEAYVQAWREIKKQEEAENVNSVELTEENAEELSVEE